MLLAVLLFAELGMYALTALNPRNRARVNIVHSIERNTLWVILILGESVLSVVRARMPLSPSFEYYLAVFLSFLLIYNILMMYMDLQPTPNIEEEDIDQHALSTSYVMSLGYVNSTVFCISSAKPCFLSSPPYLDWLLVSVGHFYTGC